MKSNVLASIALAAALLFAHPVLAETMAYPSADNASFLIDHPSNWEMEPGENVGDYVTLTGPTGVVVQFRTIPGSESAIADAIEESRKYLQETFDDVSLEEPESSQHRGMEMLSVVGAGVDKDGQAVGFSMAFFALDDGNIAELWFAVVAGDDAGADAAGKVLDSFRTP